MSSSRILGFILLVLTSTSAFAQGWGYRDHRTYRGPVFVSPIHPVYPVYRRAPPSVYWRTGHWVHSWHENRFGWWWVNSVGWSFYTAPVYPYPDPIENQTTIIYQSAPQPQVVEVPPPAPVSGDQAPPSGVGMYYFCESSQLYYPYARTCSERWKAVPRTPVE